MIESPFVKLDLSVAASVNLLYHGRRHNSYVASRSEMHQLVESMRRAFAEFGIALDPYRLKIYRLDLFVDAVLRASGAEVQNLLKLTSRCARLKKGLSYANGLTGAGKRFACTLYGKGRLLLQQAKSEGELDALLQERSRPEWKQLFRLEMRWQSAAAVRCALPALTSEPKGKMKESLDEDDKPESIGVETETDELWQEEKRERICLEELIERWDELPSLFTRTARLRCLPYDTAKLTQEVEKCRARCTRAKGRRTLAACPVERLVRLWRKRAREKGLSLDWSFLEALPAYDAVEHKNAEYWLQHSPIALWREYLRTVEGLSSDDVSQWSLEHQRALLLRAACQRPCVWEQYVELERAFIVSVEEATLRASEAGSRLAAAQRHVSIAGGLLMQRDHLHESGYEGGQHRVASHRGVPSISLSAFIRHHSGLRPSPMDLFLLLVHREPSTEGRAGGVQTFHQNPSNSFARVVRASFSLLRVKPPRRMRLRPAIVFTVHSHWAPHFGPDDWQELIRIDHEAGHYQRETSTVDRRREEAMEARRGMLPRRTKYQHQKLPAMSKYLPRPCIKAPPRE